MIVLARFLRLWIAGLVLLTSLALPAHAQLSDQARTYYNQWVKTAARAEEVIDARRASNSALEQLRAELAGYRQTFLETRTENSDRIHTLEGQLEALGPAPAEGETEPEDIAQLRSTLEDHLNQLKVPRIVSEEAYSRANGLISEIDTIVRERRKKTLLERGPSPLNPEHWPEAARELTQAATSIWNETVKQIRSDTTAERIRNNILVILFLLSLSLLLLLRGRPFARAAGEFLRRFGGRGTGVWTFVVSLLQVVLPFFGVVFLAAAINQAGILGVKGSLILESVPGWALLILMFHWLSEQLFSVWGRDSIVPVQEMNRAETRFLVDFLAVGLVLQGMILHLQEIDNISDATRAVISFPVIVAVALALLRLDRIGLKRRKLASDGDGASDDGGLAAGASRALALVRRGMYILGFVSPLLAAAGYVNAADALIYPAAATLAVLAAVMVFQRFLGDVYGLVTGRGQSAQESLFSVLAGFVLGVLVLPLLALIWGARVSDLTELWTKFLEGFQVGGVSISPASFASFALVFAVGYVLTRMLQGSLRNNLLPKTRIDPGGQNAIVSGVGYIGIFLAALVAITMAGLDLSSVAIVAGALSVGIGFGLQTIVSNFVSGIILLVERPISKGDWIEVGGLMGYVRDISVRSTRIETFDRSDVIVPNSDLISGTVTNYTRGNTVGRVIVPVGVAYSCDPRQVEKILMEIATAHPMVLMNPGPSVVFQGFGADSLDFEIRAILRDVNWVLSVKSDMNFEIARRFGEEGIEIPFAQRDIWIRNPETLAQAHSAGRADNSGQSAAAPVKPDLSDMGGQDGEGDD